MKTYYFTPENIDVKAHAMQADFPRGRVKFDIKHSALLILDMQNYFLNADSHAYIPSAQAILPRLDALREAYVTLGLPVVWTRHLNTEDDVASMSRWWRDMILRENLLSEIHPALDASQGVVIEKTQYDAFYKTDLETHLHEKGVKQVVISGVMTHLCCETTARSAFMRGLDVFFLVDGTATYNEDFHRATLRNLSHGFATLALSEEIAQPVSGA
ncbi:MAG: isochorismatase family protein [Anaerolineae bacterium]|jgi:isochorismate hydrolase|nr:isochorismatase family protein [Anaerolineae bacterium]MBT7192213.1 isochorismatase family protein [Anaerolineae bacterium]MBT7989640.1 isochorismatase family protein [Anaerolineae bacterium]